MTSKRPIHRFLAVAIAFLALAAGTALGAPTLGRPVAVARASTHRVHRHRGRHGAGAHRHRHKHHRLRHKHHRPRKTKLHPDAVAPASGAPKADGTPAAGSGPLSAALTGAGTFDSGPPADTERPNGEEPGKEKRGGEEPRTEEPPSEKHGSEEPRSKEHGSGGSPEEEESSPPPPPHKPTDLKRPAISGTPRQGDRLAATTGTWEGEPTTYGYQWMDCNAAGASCTAIAGATRSGYTLAATDVGHTVLVVVTATNAGGSQSASSAASAKVAEATSPPPAAPTNTTPPAIDGEAIEGRALSATTGTWTGSPTHYEYQWELCNGSGEDCTTITGAEASSYKVPQSDVGYTLRATVTASNAGGSQSAGSAASAVVVSVAKQPPPSPACTQTFTSVSAAASALDSASSGAAICLSAGAYGHLTLSGAHSGNVTIEPVPGSSASLEGVTVAAGADNITIHNFSISGGVSLQADVSHVDVDHNDIDGEGPGGDGEGVETLSVNCKAPNAPTYSGCESTAPDTYLTINGNEIHGYGQGNTEDAIHLNDWEHVTITDNDIYKLEEHGNHTDAMQSVFGGHGMTFERNYEHDNQSQGFFIKDGDASEVTVNDNLFLRNNNEPELYPGGEYNIQVYDTTGLTITNNTTWDGQDDILRAEGAAETLTATVNHNVEQTLDVLHESGPAYSLSENYDIFAEEPWTFKMGAQSIVERSPDFADTASGDYELVSNPGDAGVDWQPSEYVYGPTGD